MTTTITVQVVEPRGSPELRSICVRAQAQVGVEGGADAGSGTQAGSHPDRVDGEGGRFEQCSRRIQTREHDPLARRGPGSFDKAADERSPRHVDACGQVVDAMGGREVVEQPFAKRADRE